MVEVERATMAQFIAQNHITATAALADNNPNMVDENPKYPMDHWRVSMRHKGRKLTVYYSMGMGHHGKQPFAAEVLDCLASDASSVDNARSFEDWAAELGYDTDSRKAHRTFTVCERQTERLRKFLGDDLYQSLLYETERM